MRKEIDVSTRSDRVTGPGFGQDSKGEQAFLKFGSRPVPFRQPGEFVDAERLDLSGGWRVRIDRDVVENILARQLPDDEATLWPPGPDSFAHLAARAAAFRT